ncbi:MAG: DUF1538 domain-containing protein [Butyricicoccus sp.]|nr:DUF1538 domain-containing protein [Butyricicoccus sp.]
MDTLNFINPKLRLKFREALGAVAPIIAIVLLLCFSVAPISTSVLLCFLMGAVLVILGMMFFTLGAEMSMTPMGERVGTAMTKSRRLWIIVLLSFVLGFIITISEPDLQVLAGQVPSIPNKVLICAVAVGVGIFLVFALLRILFGVSLRTMLLAFYAVVFIMACFVPAELRALAFDSGGVTTGPMTVPFIMSLGVGVSAIRSDRQASNDSFGLVALCSVGPIISVMALSILYSPEGGSYELSALPEVRDSVELCAVFLRQFPAYIKEMAGSLLPIVLFFGAFQLVSLKLSRKKLIKIAVGLVYTYVGLVLFLTGANAGFMPAGSYLGNVLAGQNVSWVIVPIGAIIGYFIVKAEPAVYVLNRQVAELTSGAISSRSMGICLSAGVSVSIALAMIRVLTGVPILYLVIPGYAVALGLSFFVPDIFTAIAFDSGGVASGPMTATFLLPFAQGACMAVGGNLVSDAFGVVAMVAMTPLITIQIMGLIYRIKESRRVIPEAQLEFDALADNAIIEL